MTVSNYDQIAQWYDESILSSSLIHELLGPSLFDLLGNIEGQHICDLACGQGIIARLLAAKGATVVGIDISEKLLEIAQRHEDAGPPGITYLRDDAQTLHAVEDAAFDGVICNMALMDIPDIASTFRTIWRVLRPNGWFICVITHPCFQTPSSTWSTKEDGTVSREVQGYFAEGFWRSDNPNGVRGLVGAYHRMLSTYLNTLTESGLILERVLEPQATGPIATSRRWYEEVPAALLVRCRKG